MSTDWLAAHRDEVVLRDVRHDTVSYAGKGKAKVEEHTPGAPLVPWSAFRETRTKKKKNGAELIGMVLRPEKFQELVRSLGIDRGEPALVTSRGESSGDILFVTRLCWTFTYHGHNNVALLDDGTRKWMLEGRPLETEAPATAVRGNFVAGPGREELYASTSEVMEAIPKGISHMIDDQTLDFRPR